MNEKLTDRKLNALIDQGVDKFTDLIIEYANVTGINPYEKTQILSNVVVNTFGSCILNMCRSCGDDIKTAEQSVYDHLENLKEWFSLNLAHYENKTKEKENVTRTNH